MKQAVIPLLPEPFASSVMAKNAEGLEELRMRVGQPLQLRYADRETELGSKVTPAHLEEVLRRACRQSVYACNDTLKDGYLTIEGGHRIGVCGTAVIRDGENQTLRAISSLSIRIARQVRGCAERLLPVLRSSVLILGPPGSGKTTLLRDAVVQLSDRLKQRVALVDERGELAASVGGIPQLEVGTRTDVLVNIRKSEGIMMMLRAMNPQWIAVDEITDPSDIQSMVQASYCGVHLLATAHGSDREDLYRRPLYRSLMETGVFRTIAVLDEKKHFECFEVKE